MSDKKSSRRIDANAVLSAIKGAKIGPKTLKFGRLTVYKDWKTENYTRGRATFTAEDNSQVSFFVHVGASDLKIWLDSSNKPLPEYTVEGSFFMI